MAARRLSIVAACALLLVLPACGGGGSSRLSRDEYVAAVNKLCVRTAGEFAKLNLLNTMDDWQRNAAAIVRIRVRFNKDLAALKPPPALKDDVAAFAGAYKYALSDDKIAISNAQEGNYEGLLHGIRAEHSDNRSGHRLGTVFGAMRCNIP